uniref:Uncharacterized protein n=1 Tax=Triticum urartu TaxID=4572 RepID=A0A8R7JVE9_TRIUA
MSSPGARHPGRTPRAGHFRHYACRFCPASWRAPRPDPRRLRLLRRPCRAALRGLHQRADHAIADSGLVGDG